MVDQPTLADLAGMVERCPYLPDSFKAGIIALIDAADGDRVGDGKNTP